MKIETSRRNLIAGLAALIAAPAIVKASSLMKIAPVRRKMLTLDDWAKISMRSIAKYEASASDVMQVDVLYGSLHIGDKVTWAAEPNGPLREFVVTADGTGTLPEGTQEKIAVPDRAFLSRSYDEQVAADGAKIGDTLRIRLPNDYMVTDGPGISLQDVAEHHVLLRRDIASDLGIIPDSLALAAAALAIAPAVLKTPVTRRFWKLPQDAAA